MKCLKEKVTAPEATIVHRGAVLGCIGYNRRMKVFKRPTNVNVGGALCL